MRLWSLHPRYLDRRGLVALWREGLLAQAVLRGRTRGYRHHPQLERFQRCDAPIATLVAYLEVVRLEATRRGYAFDGNKLARARTPASRLTVSDGQLAFEWRHLRAKVQGRDAQWLTALPAGPPLPHPLFRRRRGSIESWERGVSPA